MSTNTETAARKPKWHGFPPPPPSPKILNLPRRNRHSKQHKKPTKKSTCSSQLSLLDLHQKNYSSETRKGKLERLFGQERVFSRSDCSKSVPIVVLNSSAASSLSGGRRDRVVEEEEEEGEIVEGEERESDEFMGAKWKFQAEILRAECNFLRMEREVALKKLERNRVQTERTLQSAVQTLISGKERIFAGKNSSAVLAEEIEELAEKLEQLQKSSGLDGFEAKNCNNFDKQACILQHRLEKIGGLSDDKYAKELQGLAESSLSSSNAVGNGSSYVLSSRNIKSVDVEMLRRKMNGLSKGILQRIEIDFCSILSSTENSSAASSASTSKRIEYPESLFSSRQLSQESISNEDAKCTGRCKAVVRRVVEQVRAETEQWSQMQEMLQQVREEMEELQKSCKFWEDRALNSDRDVKCLQTSVQEWKERALSLETKANATETELASLKIVLQKRKTAKRIGYECGAAITPLTSPSEQHGKENHMRNRILKKNQLNIHKAGLKEETAKEMLIAERNTQIMVSTESLPLSLGKQLEKEKRMLRRLKERCHTTAEGESKLQTITSSRRKLHNVKHSPLHDVGNLSAL